MTKFESFIENKPTLRMACSNDRLVKKLNEAYFNGNTNLQLTIGELQQIRSAITIMSMYDTLLCEYLDIE